MRRLMILVALAVAALGLSLAGGSAFAASSAWHVGYYNPSGNALSNAQASSVAVGVASLDFTTQPDTALLVTSQKVKNSTLLGDMTGKSITATFTISGATGAFTYYGEGKPSNPCGTPASVRLYFETSNAGGFDPTHYWWSNPASAVLANGTVTFKTTVDAAMWSDWNGQTGTSVPDAFAAAAANVTTVGLSFGGGCFFENGVGTTDGLGTFVLDSYTATN